MRSDRDNRLDVAVPRTTLPARPVADAIRLLQERGELEFDESVLGKWMGWEPREVTGLLSGTVAELDLVQIGQACEALHCSPYALWGPTLGREILDVYGPECWPAYIEPLFDEPSMVSEFVQRRVDQLAAPTADLRPSDLLHEYASVGARLVREWTAVEAESAEVLELRPMGRPGDARRD